MMLASKNDVGSTLSLSVSLMGLRSIGDSAGVSQVLAQPAELSETMLSLNKK